MPNQPNPTKYQSLSAVDNTRRVTRYQDSQTRKYQEKIWLDDKQYELFRRAMYGLSGYSTPQIHKMSYFEKQTIIRIHSKAQKVLNLWKQQLVNQLFEQLCSISFTKFPQNPFEKVLGDTSVGIKNFGKTVDEAFESTITFEQLQINRKQIIQKLITEKIFPEDFFQTNNQYA